MVDVCVYLRLLSLSTRTYDTTREAHGWRHTSMEGAQGRHMSVAVNMWMSGDLDIEVCRQRYN